MNGCTLLSLGAAAMALAAGCSSAIRDPGSSGVGDAGRGSEGGGGNSSSGSGSSSGATGSSSSSGGGSGSGGSGIDAGPKESPECATVTQPGQVITDAVGNAWTLVGPSTNRVASVNGKAAGFSANVVKLVYVGHTVSQENASGGWWGWVGGAWSAEANPTAACAGAGDAGAGAVDAGGAFSVSGGQIIAPDGKVFQTRGIDLEDDALAAAVSDAAATPLRTLFPGLGIVRVPCYSFTTDTSAALQTAVTRLTSLGIVVELENHLGPAGQSGGGGTYTGAALATETHWYASLAAAFASNPYVWFGTLNEPSGNTADIVNEHVAIYDAIRGAGNDGILMLMMQGGYTTSGFTASSYAKMKNVVWDTHFYGWVSNYSIDIPTIESALTAQIANAQSIPSADGVVPVVIGEYGDSTTGTGVDANGTQTVQVVGAAAYSSMAWSWDDFGSGGDTLQSGGVLTAYGQQVAQIIK